MQNNQFSGLTLQERFWSKVTILGNDECWTWNGAQIPCGYGSFFYNGRARLAHRIAWELKYGKDIPDGMHACHHCDNKQCVNPNHIFIGTAFDNMRDAWNKGITHIPRHDKQYMTHCLRGHELTPENTTVEKKTGRRRCRKCRNMRDIKKYYARKQKKVQEATHEPK
jgi:hypothetical protein